MSEGNIRKSMGGLKRGRFQSLKVDELSPLHDGFINTKKIKLDSELEEEDVEGTIGFNPDTKRLQYSTGTQIYDVPHHGTTNDLSDRVDTLETEQQASATKITNNENDIETNQTNITTNTDDIQVNTGNISTNTTAISDIPDHAKNLNQEVNTDSDEVEFRKLLIKNNNYNGELLRFQGNQTQYRMSVDGFLDPNDTNYSFSFTQQDNNGTYDDFMKFRNGHVHFPYTPYMDKIDELTEDAGVTVDGVNVKELKSDVDGFHDELKNLSEAEINQLKNIDENNISGTQWEHLSSMDQDVSASSNVQFNTATLEYIESEGTELGVKKTINMNGDTNKDIVGVNKLETDNIEEATTDSGTTIEHLKVGGTGADSGGGLRFNTDHLEYHNGEEYKALAIDEDVPDVYDQDLNTTNNVKFRRLEIHPPQMEHETMLRLITEDNLGSFLKIGGQRDIDQNFRYYFTARDTVAGNPYQYDQFINFREGNVGIGENVTEPDVNLCVGGTGIKTATIQQMEENEGVTVNNLKIGTDVDVTDKAGALWYDADAIGGTRGALKYYDGGDIRTIASHNHVKQVEYAFGCINMVRTGSTINFSVDSSFGNKNIEFAAGDSTQDSVSSTFTLTLLNRDNTWIPNKGGLIYAIRGDSTTNHPARNPFTVWTIASSFCVFTIHKWNDTENGFTDLASFEDLMGDGDDYKLLVSFVNQPND